MRSMDRSNENTLKPCPFCDNNRPKLIEWFDRLSNNGSTQYWIVCDVCGVETKRVWNKLEVILKWNTRKISIEVYQQDWIPGFAAFRDDKTLDANGKAHVVLNLGAFLATVVKDDIPVEELPYFIAESIMHEVIHVLEAWAKVEFSEEKVNALINKYSEAAEKLRNN